MALQAQSQIESNELTLSKLKRKRGTLRGVVTKQITKLESDILIPHIAVEDLEESFQLLTEKGEELKLIDSQIESLIEIDGIEAKFDIEEEYREKIMRTRFKVLKLIQNIKESSTDNSWQDFNVSLNSSSRNEKVCILLLLNGKSLRKGFAEFDFYEASYTRAFGVDLVILNHGQVTRTILELASFNYHTTPTR
ncbi:hypothetical protein TNCV_3263631 [Trichonephila clavipes]|nr:hypothetical protein TNCV_3263631 [Trichonephila clavipes]